MEAKRNKKWSLGWKTFLKVSISGTLAISATFAFNWVDDRYIDQRRVGGGSYHLSINVTPDTVYIDPAQHSTAPVDSQLQSNGAKPSSTPPDSISVKRTGNIWNIFWRPGYDD